MQYTTDRDIEARLIDLLDAAQQEPVFIERGQQQVAVLLSVLAATASAAQPHASSSTSVTPSPIKPQPKA